MKETERSLRLESEPLGPHMNHYTVTMTADYRIFTWKALQQCILFYRNVLFATVIFNI